MIPLASTCPLVVLLTTGRITLLGQVLPLDFLEWGVLSCTQVVPAFWQYLPCACSICVAQVVPSLEELTSLAPGWIPRRGRLSVIFIINKSPHASKRSSSLNHSAKVSTAVVQVDRRRLLAVLSPCTELSDLLKVHYLQP